MAKAVLACLVLLLVSTQGAIVKTRNGNQSVTHKVTEPRKPDAPHQSANVPSSSANMTNMRSPNPYGSAFLNRSGSMAQGIITTTSCFTDTGGTCMVQECAAWRGAACGSGYKCICPRGSCSGSDGKCYREEYEHIGKVRIRNVMYPDHYLYVSTWFSGLYLSTTYSPQSDFIVKKLPDDAVILTPPMYPQYVVRTRRAENCDDNHDCTVSYSPEVDFIGGLWSDMSAITASLRFEKAPSAVNKDGQYVMIASADYPDRYYSASMLSSTVGTNRGDGGLYTYWTVDPPLPFKLPEFRGRRCSFNCGW